MAGAVAPSSAMPAISQAAFGEKQELFIVASFFKKCRPSFDKPPGAMAGWGV
jgi:hypothetical protein